MGSIFSKSKKKKQAAPPKKKQVSVNDKDMALSKIMILRDRAQAKITQTEKDEIKLKAKAVELSKQGLKTQALFKVKQVKRLRESRKKLHTRIDFLEKQKTQIEGAMDDADFTNTLKDSNKALEQLNSEINLEEIEIAKELQAEGEMNREQIMALLQEDDEDDQDLMEEVNKIEAQMLAEGFEGHTEAPVVEKEQEKEVVAVQEERQAQLA